MQQIALRSAVALVATLVSSGAYALSNRTFVSGSGSDSNPCNLTAPCRSFAGAIAQTNPGGEIAVLDTAGYGAVTIQQAVSIVNEEGVEAGITVTSGDAITINAGASDVVNLRGLTLTGVGNSSGNGITLITGGNLNIQNCVIRGLTNNGLNLVPTGTADINVANTIVSGNSSQGILVKPLGSGNTVTVSFEQVQAIHNGSSGFVLDGTLMTGSLLAIAADSLASGNGGDGFLSSSAFAQATTTFTLVNSKSANNGVGLFSAGDNAAIFLNGSTVTGSVHNSFLLLGGAVIQSYGNNAINDTTNFAGLTSASLH